MTDAASPYEVHELIRRLELERHPEGGWYRRRWTDPAEHDGRSASSAILFLLAQDERSHWHRIDAVEIWHHYRGAPLELQVSVDGRSIVDHVLGDDILKGQSPQVVVPAGAWQSARSIGTYTLAGCTVTPAFDFDGFELAPAGWHPGG